MFFFRVAKDERIIQVGRHKVIWELSQGVVNVGLEGC
jgi:hypothetical protein